MWIDTHCHLDAAEFDADRDRVRDQSRALGVELCVYPAVDVKTLDAVRTLAHRHGDVYALGIHPLYVDRAADLAMAESIVMNAKVQRPAVCNAAETLLVDGSIADQFLPRMAQLLTDKNVELRADEHAHQHVRRPAWSRPGSG